MKNDDTIVAKEGLGPMKPTIMDILKEATSFLLDEGYHIIDDTTSSPPYQRTGWHVIYDNGTNVIKIHQVDWRDFYYLFAIRVNNKEVFVTQLANYNSLTEMAGDFVRVLKDLL